MTQEEINKWEKKNIHNITGWDADYVTKPGYKIITYEINGGQRIVECSYDVTGNHIRLKI